ncbi:AsnC family protein [Bordetella petrii]|uniref:siroheme decarboxylase subunit beta n=1 Tax=Bordetella petrii TaxID=94624 RepID=UPI001E4C438E|nr:AsnC family protein [Bordetella petrii]MCD0501397.1 AsnC family protein [Bordetella petrii]
MSTSRGLSPSQALHLRRLLESGLPLAEQPYALLARQIGVHQEVVLAQMQRWNRENLFRRIGLVLNHRALGYQANAMLVLDVPDVQVDLAGRQLGQSQGISLCYQRPRRPPHWPYNLFCMMHGRQRDAVRLRAETLLRELELAHLPHQLLFSTHAFKQCGGRYTQGSPHG